TGAFLFLNLSPTSSALSDHRRALCPGCRADDADELRARYPSVGDEAGRRSSPRPGAWICPGTSRTTWQHPAGVMGRSEILWDDLGVADPSDRVTKRRIGVAGLVLAALCASALFGASRPARGASAEGPRIVTVVKVLGIGWFERMQQGIDRFAMRTGVDATMTGGHDASPATQIRILRGLIAASNRPAAITVVPNSPQSLEPVLARAPAAGIKVVTHEASNQVNTD